MKIAIQGYFDNNYGDDRMVLQLLEKLGDNDITLVNLKGSSDKLRILPFEKRFPNILFITHYHFINNIDEYDLCIKIGGSLFQFDSITTSLLGKYKYYRKKRELKQMKKAKIPYYILGCNITKPKNKWAESLLREELKLVKHISVRDKFSEKVVREINNETSISYHTDILFSIKLPKKNENIQPVLGISVYNNQKNPNINIKFSKKSAELADQFIEEESGEVNLYCFDSNSENDIFVAQAIKHYSRYPDKLHIIPYAFDLADFESKLMLADKMIAVRFHSIISAIHARIPVMCISYSDKTDNFIKSIKPDKLVMNMNKYIDSYNIYSELREFSFTLKKKDIKELQQISELNFSCLESKILENEKE